MATQTTKRAKDKQTFGSSPYGNLSMLSYRMATASTGALVDSDGTTAMAINDVARIGIIPAGFRLDDMQLIVSDAFAAGVTASVGFAYKDGVDVATAPQSATYFGSGIALSAVARIRASGANAPVVLSKDAWLTVTVTGAANNSAGLADLMLTGEQIGV
jgi:hypothetical protein